MTPATIEEVAMQWDPYEKVNAASQNDASPPYGPLSSWSQKYAYGLL
jgi:hypothetical protein